MVRDDGGDLVDGDLQRGAARDEGGAPERAREGEGGSRPRLSELDHLWRRRQQRGGERGILLRHFQLVARLDDLALRHGQGAQQQPSELRDTAAVGALLGQPARREQRLRLVERQQREFGREGPELDVHEPGRRERRHHHGHSEVLALEVVRHATDEQEAGCRHRERNGLIST